MKYNILDLIESARTNKIEAIKTLREDTGLGIKEAKDVIEILLGTHRVVTVGQYLQLANPIREDAAAKLERLERDHKVLQETLNRANGQLYEISSRADQLSKENNQFRSVIDHLLAAVTQLTDR